MVTIERTNNLLYYIKFEDDKEENWLEAETMKHMEEARFPVGDVGYNFIHEFYSVTFSGEFIEILDNQSRKWQFLTGRIKYTSLTIFSLNQNI